MVEVGILFEDGSQIAFEFMLVTVVPAVAAQDQCVLITEVVLAYQSLHLHFARHCCYKSIIVGLVHNLNPTRKLPLPSTLYPCSFKRTND